MLGLAVQISKELFFQDPLAVMETLWAEEIEEIEEIQASYDCMRWSVHALCTPTPYPTRDGFQL